MRRYVHPCLKKRTDKRYYEQKSVEFAVPCVSQPYFYFLDQNGYFYAVGEEKWQIASSLNEFLEEYI